MSNLKETCLASEHIYKGKFLDVWKDKVELPNGKTSSREYIKHPGAVVIIPVLPDRKIFKEQKILFLEKYSHFVKTYFFIFFKIFLNILKFFKN